MQKKSVQAGFLGKGTVFGEIAISGISDDGQSMLLALYAELVGSSRVWGELQQTEHGHSGEDLDLTHVTGSGFTRASSLRPELAVFASDVEVVLPELLTAAWHTEYQRQISLCDFTGQKKAAKVSGYLCVAGNENNA